tara:strand:- start:126 stop:428 length:303 start_codon:yes stop_codon:yes gene_type:complete
MQLKQGTFCPLIKKDCIQMQCSWFTQLRGVHPQTGQEIDEWLCAVSALPLLQIEVAKQARSGAAATESFRNEFVNMNGINPLLNALTQLPPATNEIKKIG